MAETQITISCIIPAYNEAARIGRVLDVALAHPALAEVIVVDDGSDDGTAGIAARHGAEVLAVHPNGGKSAAVFHAAARARGTHVLMLDADLSGLTADHITRLIAPVQGGTADVTISLRGNSPRLWQAIGVDYISGERVLPRSDLAAAPIAGFGLEVHLNRQWRLDRRRIAVIRCPDLASPAKTAKKGIFGGIASDIGMLGDIFRTAGTREVLRQLIFFRKAVR